MSLFGYFKQVISVPSFADSVVKMDHGYDGLLLDFFAKLQIPDELKDLNPDPKTEHKHLIDKAENEVKKTKEETVQIPFLRKIYSNIRSPFLKSNLMLLSRVFIYNAKKAGLEKAFETEGIEDLGCSNTIGRVPNKRVRIIDLGCGLAPYLIGILAYLGPDRVEYLGIDSNQIHINTCQKMYKQLSNVKFAIKNMLQVLEEKEHQEQYDLVLMAHPNFERERVDSKFTAFSKCFAGAQKLLTKGGVIYSTFYYSSENDYFNSKLKGELAHLKGRTFQNTAFLSNLLRNSITNEDFCPEKFSYLSAPKP